MYSSIGLYVWISLLIGILSSGLSEAKEIDHQDDSLQARDSLPPGYVASPYYPAPNGGWIPDWSNSYAKAAAIVQNMTLAEKVNLTSGTGYFMVCMFHGYSGYGIRLDMI